jgi:hypothetical protein
MNKAGDGLNWSQVAQDAFSTAVLRHNATREDISTMQDLVERLKASKVLGENQIRDRGIAFGNEWAMTSATYSELVALDQFSDRLDGAPDPIALVECLLGEDEPSRDAIANAWEALLGGPEPSPALAEGFMQGALATFAEVKDKI